MNFFRFGKSKEREHLLDKSKLPRHIAIIMDGNGRWAKKRNLPRIAGHRQGVETLRTVITKSSEIGIEFLTLYAFSTENWNRPKDEVNGLMELLVNYLKKEVKELNQNNVRIKTIGEISYLPKEAQEEIYKAKDLTKENNGLTVIIALNYGSRSEILNAVRKVAQDYKDGIINEISDLSDEKFEYYLHTSEIPDPELLIRTSGEIRISNFLLWQIAYSELWFTEKFWPDFKSEDLMEALIDFQQRNRRFGGI